MNLPKRILNLLDSSERKTGVKVIISIFVNALLDFISLASLLPVLYFMLEDNENIRVAIWFSLFALVVVFLKSVISILLGRFQTKYLLSIYKRLSTALFKTYYNNGFLYIKEHGYSSLGHAVNFMCYIFSVGLLSPMMRVAADVALVSLVTVALLVYDWFTALVLYVAFIPLIALYVLFIKKRVTRYGMEEFSAKKDQARIVADTFRGYQELEINGAFDLQKNSFEVGIDKICTNRTNLDTLQRIPLFISELAIIIGLAVVVLTAGTDAKITVGVFAVAAFRLLPALRAIVSGYTQIQNNISSLDTIEEGLISATEHFDCNDDKSLNFSNTISIRGLSFNYGEETISFKDFVIRKGEYVGFSGYSGVGKTTLFNLLLGFLVPAEGNVLIDDVSLTLHNRKNWLQYTGYVPQEVFIFKGSIAENIALGYSNIDYVRVSKVLEMVSLYEWVNSLPDGVESILGEGGSRLSGGQKQRIGIARALYKGAQVLLLDEATSALDNTTEREINIMLTNLRKEFNGLTILSIAQRESTLAYCNRIINLENNGN